MNNVIKGLVVMLLAASLAVISGCSNGNQGNPQAREAALSYAEFSAMTVGAVEGRDTGNDLTATFVEAWDSSDTPCEIYMIETNNGTYWLTAVAEENGTWQGMLNDMGLLSKNVSQEKLAEFKAKVDSKLAQSGNGGTPSAVDSNEDDVSIGEINPEMEAIATSQIMGEGATYDCAENGYSFTVDAVDQDASGVMSYEITFAGIGEPLNFTYSGIDTADGTEVATYFDGGFGITLQYSPDKPDRIVVVGSSSGSQEYAGTYTKS